MYSLHYSTAAATTINPVHADPANPQTSTPTSISTTPLKRTRAKRSCDFCRKRKSRCDADTSIPCSNCRAWGYTCEFQTVRKKRGPPSVYVDNLEKRCKKMERLLVALTKLSIKELESNDFKYDVRLHATNSPPVASDSSSDDDDDDDEDDFDPTADIQERLTNLDIKDYDTIKYSGQSAGLELVENCVLKTRPYVQWPGRKDVVLQVTNQNELLIVRTDRGAAGKRLDVGLSMNSAIFDEPPWPSSLSHRARTASSKKPAKPLSDKLIDLYFAHIHPFFPIVNKSRFFDQYHSEQRPSILVYAVLALSFRFASRHFPGLVSAKDGDAAEYADGYFRKVMKRLRDIAMLRSRLCHVQAALLMTLYLDLEEDNGLIESVQWFTLGKAIRMAQDLGLHRSCEHWNLPRSEIEMRHRVFYACYVLDRWIGARSGKPLTILDRDFDTALPSPYEVVDDPSGEEQPQPPIYRPFLLLIKLSEILGRVLKAVYAPKAKHSNGNAGLDDSTILVVFDRRLKNWRASLDEPLHGTHISVTQKDSLLVFYNTIVLLLHRPFIQLSPDRFPELQAIATESRNACTEAACNISKIMEKAPSAGTYFSLCLPTCFVYAMFQSSLVHLSNVLQDRQSQGRLKTLERSLKLLKSLKDQCPASRAIEILTMLVTVNNLPLSSGLLVGHKTRRSLKKQQQQPQPMNNNTESSSSSSNNLLDAEYPKSNHVLFERMMNTSVVGGITPDIRQDVESAMSQQPMHCYLPQPETSQLSIDSYNHHHMFPQHPTTGLSYPLEITQSMGAPLSSSSPIHASAIAATTLHHQPAPAVIPEHPTSHIYQQHLSTSSTPPPPPPQPITGHLQWNNSDWEFYLHSSSAPPSAPADDFSSGLHS